MRQSLHYWIIAGLLVGCSGGDDALPHTAFVPEVVRTFSPPPGGFVAPIDLAASERGVWTLDFQDAVVHAFGSEGSYGDAFAKRGGGPGELAQPSALGIAGDTVWVLNGGNARIEYYATDGRWLASQPLPREAGAVFHMVRAGGSFYGTSFTGPDLVVGLSGDPADGAATLTRSFGHELVAEARRIAPNDGPGAYRLELVAGNLWVLHTKLPLVGIYSLAGELQRMVHLPVAGSDRRARLPDGSEAPAPPVGAVAAWHVRPGTVYLLTHQESAAGQQLIVVASEQGELVGVTEAPRPHRFAFGVVHGDRIHAMALDSDTHETSMFTLRVPPSHGLDPT